MKLTLHQSLRALPNSQLLTYKSYTAIRPKPYLVSKLFFHIPPNHRKSFEVQNKWVTPARTHGCAMKDVDAPSDNKHCSRCGSPKLAYTVWFTPEDQTAVKNESDSVSKLGDQTASLQIRLDREEGNFQNQSQDSNTGGVETSTMAYNEHLPNQ